MWAEGSVPRACDWQKHYLSSIFIRALHFLFQIQSTWGATEVRTLLCPPGGMGRPGRSANGPFSPHTPPLCLPFPSLTLSLLVSDMLVMNPSQALLKPTLHPWAPTRKIFRHVTSPQSDAHLVDRTIVMSFNGVCFSKEWG